MTTRLRAWTLQWLIAIDQLAAVLLCAPFYVLFGRGKCPSADETISSIVGRRAAAGARWALLCERLIDCLFTTAGADESHCRRSIEWDEVA